MQKLDVAQVQDVVRFKNVVGFDVKVALGNIRPHRVLARKIRIEFGSTNSGLPIHIHTMLCFSTDG